MKMKQAISNAFRTLASFREFALIAVLIVSAILMTAFSDVFLTKANIEAILLGLSVEATIAVGMVILLISGGLDLSVGSTLAFTGVVTGLALTLLGLWE
jgi:ribose/xylose/arabinose/galactoside ABC-type transport system permease subunit